MTPVLICGRGGCTAPILPPPSRPRTPAKSLGARRYCSHRCAAIVNAAKRGHDAFVAIGRKGREARRKKGTHALKDSEKLLMAAGRFFEAARSIYDRAYSAGWMARHSGARQMPARRTA